MKKYLFGALALPLLFACSSDDLFEKEAVSNDQFAGIEKVDATFSMDEALTRMDDGSWNPQEGDLWGFAWLGDGAVIDPSAEGIAYQNHNLIQTGGIFKPQTSIYVGKYYIYRPYDETTVSPQAINFKSLEKQTIAEGYKSTTDAWKNLAKTAINIGSKWTVVGAGWEDAEHKTWDKSGIGQNYKIYAAMFSNQTGLDMTYANNDVEFDGTKEISGATDIKFTPAAGIKVGAAKIYGGTVQLEGAAKSFTYAPKASPEAEAYDAVPGHDGEFWADKSGAAGKGVEAANGFAFTAGAIALTTPDANKDGIEDGISTEGKGTGWIWFNSLPVTAGNGAVGSTVETALQTTYGKVTVNKTVEQCAYAFEQPHEGAVGYETEAKEWIKLNNAADALNKGKDQKTWKLATDGRNTFINQYGNHKGKYAIDVDFSKGVMHKMHIKSDADLQTALKYYIASGKDETGAVLLLDKDGDNEFKLSKISIALLQTINKDIHNNVLVKACDEDLNGTPSAEHTPAKIVITQEGSAGKTAVPALNYVFAAATDVYLASDCTWAWSEDIKTGEVVGKLNIDAGVKSITNLGTLNVTTTNIELSEAAATLANAQGATMNITEVTTVKNDLTNLGIINVGSASNTAAELRAYGADITNDATGLKEDLKDEKKSEFGIIHNFGAVGVTAGQGGHVYNYGGYIKMEHNDAITLLSSNEIGGNFAAEFNANTNKMGIVELPEGNPYALVSVANGAETGFIKYNWTAETYTHDPGNVKYNTIIVSGKKIAFTGAAATEIQYIEFAGTRTQVVNTVDKDDATDYGKLPNLKGIYVHPGKSIIIEKTNGLRCKVGAFLGDKATVYRGGVFTKGAAEFVADDAKAENNYFGKWSLDQIVEY